MGRVSSLGVHVASSRPRAPMDDENARDIFVISDLHLGDGGMRDNFEAAKKTSPLRAFIDHAVHLNMAL